MSAQILASVFQFVYGGISGHFFSAKVYGEFSAASTLSGLTALLTTTGLPSWLLKEPEITSLSARRARTLALVGGVAAGTIYVVAVPLWVAALGAPLLVDVIPGILVGQLLSPIAAVESALLRRGARQRRDSITLATAAIVSVIVGAIIIVVSQEPWTLSLSIAVQPVILWIAVKALRGKVDFSGTDATFRNILSFSWRISYQNVGFYILGQLPGWGISRLLGPTAFGQYVRASTLAGVPSTSVAIALTRAVQPYWSRTSRNEVSLLLLDAQALVAGASLPLFAILAGVGPEVSRIWLGPGWELVATVVPILAIAFGIQVPYTVMANAAEMLGELGAVRVSQNWNLVPIAAGLVATLVFSTPIAVCVGLAIGQLIAILVLDHRLGRKFGGVHGELIIQFGCAALWGLPVGLSAAAGALIARAVIAPSLLQEICSAGVGSGMGFFVAILIFRWTPLAALLRRRGLLRALPSIARRTLGI